ncbi:predicted protein [Naegleria gruberi]|uniref:Predicted protein n=1 Tax=Naegleria gruberi TaxID=5762 RepID=D2VE72_NAEGR|nr:uncharacterized protein NAEGRDRAFT_67176 [Naegleria gruberi]EFC44745.1 predicted protein [Naegleria gruberi]|eukprot:XP_002677489.1 predicted protein [Naegleria gruberi strain NEG-M]
MADGFIIYGRYLERDVLNEIALRTGHCFTVYNMDDLTDVSQLKIDMDLQNVNGLNDSQVVFEYLENANYHNFESTLNEYSSFFDRHEIESSSFLTKVSQVYSYEDRTCPSYFGVSNPSTSSVGTRLVNFLLFRDFKNKAVMVVRIDDERRNESIIIGGSASIYVFFALLSTILSLALQGFFEIGIILRVSSIQKIIKKVTQDNDPTLRIPPPKHQLHEKDEIGQLEINLNEMLRALELVQHKLSKDNEMMKTILERITVEGEKCKAVMNSIQDFIFIVECESGKLISSNETFERKVSNGSKNVL